MIMLLAGDADCLRQENAHSIGIVHTAMMFLTVEQPSSDSKAVMGGI